MSTKFLGGSLLHPTIVVLILDSALMYSLPGIYVPISLFLMNVIINSVNIFNTDHFSTFMQIAGLTQRDYTMLNMMALYIVSSTVKYYSIYSWIRYGTPTVIEAFITGMLVVLSHTSSNTSVTGIISGVNVGLKQVKDTVELFKAPKDASTGQTQPRALRRRQKKEADPQQDQLGSLTQIIGSGMKFVQMLSQPQGAQPTARAAPAQPTVRVVPVERKRSILDEPSDDDEYPPLDDLKPEDNADIDSLLDD